jgi:vanillate O-demethylase monooxygenase subunit
MSFIRNIWYAAAWASEVTDAPYHAQIAGDHILLYRNSAGQIVALSDTCPHRFAPLHLGKIVGDAIECPYHGLRFDATGRCTHNPFNPNVKLSAAKIAAYPVVEQDRFVWIWIGDAEQADKALIPPLPWLRDTENYCFTSDRIMDQPLSYELILNNLMDLTHGQFLHPTTLGNEALAEGSAKTWLDGNRVISHRWNPDGSAPTLFTISGVVEPHERVDYWNEMQWDAPGVYYLEVGVTPTGRPREEGAFLGSIHMLTPVDANRTIYRYIIFRTFAPDNVEITKSLEDLAEYAFRQEDEPMIVAVQERMAGRSFWDLSPLTLKTDQAAILVRRAIDRLRSSP